MIDQRLVASALEAVDTTNFERFAQTFYGAIQDREFIPLGGVHDGGAEGFDVGDVGDPEIFSDEAATSFIQVSKQATTRAKIRKTIGRLREYGRNPKVLTYITSVVVPDIDKEERVLTAELGCKVAIRDAKYIEIYINSNTATEGAFYSYLQPSISHLYSPGASELGEETPKHIDRTLAVFLRQEVDNRSSRSSLMESISDSLIIWALRDTDPDPSKGILINRPKILERIEAALPTSKSFIRGVLDRRLDVLASKEAPGGRQIRHYRKTNEFCLPFATRTAVAIENADDDLIKMRVSCVFEDRLSERAKENIDGFRKLIVDVCHKTLERVFEHQGLKVAQFVTNDDVDDEMFTDVAEIATEAVRELSENGDNKSLIRRHVLMVLRGTFYMSSQVERAYLEKLSRTYVLLLLLKNEPKVVEYFSSMAGSFVLYVGSDILIRALSEIYLEESSQTTINLLKILKGAGSSLILTQTTVEEVATHIRRQIFEFENAYQNNEHRMSPDLVEYIDRLLIRAYFYAKISPVGGVKPPNNWRTYISQFCNFSDVRSNRGDTELADYMMRKFGLIYETTRDALKDIDTTELKELTEAIQAAKERNGKGKEAGDILAYNDALQVLRVYSCRREGNENSPGNPFGFKTWWLTQDGKVRRASIKTIRNHGGKLFMMRPEFLLNYIGMAPSMASVRESYRAIFPSALGVRLSSGIRDAEFNKVMRDAATISQVDDARAGAMITALSSKLQSDAMKEFDVHW